MVGRWITIIRKFPGSTTVVPSDVFYSVLLALNDFCHLFDRHRITFYLCQVRLHTCFNLEDCQRCTLNAFFPRGMSSYMPQVVLLFWADVHKGTLERSPTIRESEQAKAAGQ